MYDTEISPLPGMSVILYDFLETIFPDIVYISQYQVNIEENKINLKGHGVGSNLSYPTHVILRNTS
jgi:hypothetical protein